MNLKLVAASVALAFAPLANAVVIFNDDFTAATGQTVSVTGAGSLASAPLSIGGDVFRTIGIINTSSVVNRTTTLTVVDGFFFADGEAGSGNVAIYGFQYTGGLFSTLGATPQTLTVAFDVVLLDQTAIASLAVPSHTAPIPSGNTISLTAAPLGPTVRYEISAFGDWSNGFDLRFYQEPGTAGLDITIDNVSLVPAPATLAILGLGLAGIGLSRRKAVSA